MASIEEKKTVTESKIAEKEEESKLKAKYPQLQRPAGPQFLQKRLQKGQKFFDSGDYNMAKAAAAKNTPKSRLSEFKNATNQSSMPVAASATSTSPLPPMSTGATAGVPSIALPANPTGEVIPTPDCLATRKASIHVPSKLVSSGP